MFHVAFTDGHPRNETENSIYYLQYSEGTFKLTDGSVIGGMDDLPLSPKEADLVYDAKVSGVRSWIWDIALDSLNHPFLAYTRLPNEEEHIYHLAYSNGHAWTDFEIGLAGGWFPETPPNKEEREKHYSGGISLNQNYPFVAYLSRPEKGIFEIELNEYHPSSGLWTTQVLTSSSKMNNLRPVYVRGTSTGKEIVLWMSGKCIHYTDFTTGIKLLSLDINRHAGITEHTLFLL